MKHLINTTGLLAILLFSMFVHSPNYAQENTRQIEIDKILLNDEVLPEVNYKNIVLSDKDSIKVHYSLKAKDKLKTAFMFRVKIENREEEPSFTTNRTFVMYKELPEGKYTITISAFDPMNKWSAEAAVVKFVVDNREASLLKKIKKLTELAEKKDTVKVAMNESGGGFFGFDLLSVLSGLLVGLVSFGIFFIFFRDKSTDNKKTSDIYKDHKMQNSDSKSINAEQYEEVLTENGNLRAEIAALRGQIDALQTRGNELSKQNRKLQQHVAKLQNNKKELEELQTQKDDLFAVIIHDIKNPASLIKSLVELLRSYDLSAVEQQEVINDLFETSRRIISLSQEVTKVLALESNRLQLNLEQTRINEVVNDLARRNSIAANNKNIKLILELDENIPPNFFDVNKIDEVIDNLLSNAIKFSEKNGQVRLLTKKEDNNMIVEISDNGLGLSEEDVQKAFQRGVKLSAIPTAGESSSGFGLWIVKKLVEAHKGKVWIRSALGRGSTFAFSIPYIDYPEEEESEENASKEKNNQYDDDFDDTMDANNNYSDTDSGDEDRELKI